MATLDEITKEKQRVSEALARVEAQRETLAGQVSELEATERLHQRWPQPMGGERHPPLCAVITGHDRLAEIRATLVNLAYSGNPALRKPVRASFCLWLKKFERMPMSFLPLPARRRAGRLRRRLYDECDHSPLDRSDYDGEGGDDCDGRSCLDSFRGGIN